MIKLDILRRIKTIMVLAIMVICSISCGGNDEKGDNNEVPVIPGNPDNPGGFSATLDISLLLGMWKDSNRVDGYEILDFKSDNTFKSEVMVEGVLYREEGRWSVDVTTRKIKLDNGNTTQESEIIKLTGTELVMFNCVYFRVSDSEDNTQNGNEAIRGEVATSFKGRGVQSDPFVISSPAELRKMSDDAANGETYEGKYFIMTSDIVINKNVFDTNDELVADTAKLEQWIPIKTFHGIFDGQGHTISGLYITNPKGAFIGLFSEVAKKAVIKRLTIADSYLSGENVIGSVSGTIATDATISECSSIRSVIVGAGRVGGIVGNARNDTDGGYTIKNCANFSSVRNTTSAYAGGIIAYSWCPTNHTKTPIEGNVINCLNKGNVSSNHSTVGAGGIIGHADRNITIENCVNIGIVGSNGNQGRGIVAEYASYSTIQNNYYLKSSGLQLINNGNSNIVKNNTGMTSDEMKEQKFLDTLNKNAITGGESYCQWKHGKDGFPTLEFIYE